MTVEDIGLEAFEQVLWLAEDSATTNFEMDFVSDMQERYDKWGTQMFVSERQWALLERIADQ